MIDWLSRHLLLATLVFVVAVVTPGFIRLEQMIDDAQHEAEDAAADVTVEPDVLVADIAQAVARYCNAHDGCRGPAGPPSSAVPGESGGTGQTGGTGEAGAPASETQEPEIQDLESGGPEAQEPETQDAEIQDSEVQEAEVQDPEIDDPAAACPPGFSLQPLLINAPGGQIRVLVCT